MMSSLKIKVEESYLKTWEELECDFGAKALEYWMISSLKIKLNRSWKLARNWSVTLVQKLLNIEWFLSLKMKLNCSWKLGEELECAFDVVGKILMSRIWWNYGNTWANGTGHIIMIIMIIIAKLKQFTFLFQEE
jgi:hypothetical protein